jgi:Uma2 family endonuclease
MSTAEQISQPLVSGEKLSREEFLRRWEALPDVKFAELLEGVVYMPSPLTRTHGSKDNAATFWLAYYAGFTPGCDATNQETWLMLRDAPQPDCCLFIKPEYGGQSSVERGYGSGAPELIVEVAVSSAARDLGPKLRLYLQAGVQEYINVLVKESRVVWRRLAGGKWVELQPDADGLLRSVIFPGLWLDPAALLRKDIPRLTEVLRQGLASPEHRRLVEKLAKRA